MRPVLGLTILATLFVCSGPCSRAAEAQYFGKNKVEYADFDFRVIESAHFDIYYYPEEEAAARLAARLAERWYSRLSRVLDHQLEGRQPLVLYGSHPEFAQTNVVSTMLGEGIGGVTEPTKRRIAMPFAPTLGETDRVLGHEIAHAFQFDMARRHGGRFTLPLWSMEGMAQYLSLGRADADTATWLRDAVVHDLIPHRQDMAAGRFSPYRYGHAIWAYLGGRFGDGVIGDVLRAKRAGRFDKRIREITGTELSQLFDEWRTASYDAYPSRGVDHRNAAAPLLRDRKPGRLYLGPALSPDGRETVFFSEEDRLSVDLFLTDTETGRVRRKLATRAASPRFESLQSVRSAGSWSWSGDRFVFAAVERGVPTLVVLDMSGSGREKEISFPQFGQILTPAWSPDGGAIAFSVLDGGFTDLYVYDVDTGTLRRLTNDAFADLQPVFSPDGRRIAFVSDRFSSDLSSLAFAPCQLAVVDLISGNVAALPAIDGAKQMNPQWSADGTSLYFIADPGGISNVYRLDLEDTSLYQLTDVQGGVTGLTGTSPALSAARSAPVLAFTVFEAGHYEIEVLKGTSALTGTRVSGRTPADSMTLPPATLADGSVDMLLRDAEFGLPAVSVAQLREYDPKLSLERIGQPYVSSGGGPFGSYVRGGGSLLFGDMLGQRKLATAVQVGTRMRDLAIEARFLNRESRWNWGALAEVLPSIYQLPRRRVTEQDGEPALARETDDFQRIQVRLAGLLAYPLSHVQRLEFTAGARHAWYERDVRSNVSSLTTRRVLSEARTVSSGGAPTTVGEVSAALVGDTAVLGPTGPIIGTRYRFEITPTAGDLSFMGVLLDYRRYVMPARPYTLAVRLVHSGRYGPDAWDSRLMPTFVGSRYFVRGYGWTSRGCQWNEYGECATLEELLGTRILVGNLEVRAPLWGLASRQIRYDPVPVDLFAFADGGVAWSRRRALILAGADRRTIRSVGAGVRVNALGWPLELAAIHALDGPTRGWSFDLSFRSGF
jgi:hypothetical protein